MPTAPTIRQIVQAYYDDLASWAPTVGARVRFSRDPLEPYELLGAMGANDCLIVVNWTGDDELGENLQNPLARHEVEVWIGKTRGLAPDRDLWLLKPIATERVLLDIVEDCRQRVLSLQFPAEITRRLARYAGTKQVVTPAGLPLAALKSTYRLDAGMRQMARRDVTF
jgi:hypothetical protein